MDLNNRTVCLHSSRKCLELWANLASTYTISTPRVLVGYLAVIGRCCWVCLGPYLLPLEAQHPSYHFCPSVCLCVSDRSEDTLVVQDFGNIFTRLPLKRRFPEVCKGVGSPWGSRWVK